MFLLGVFITLGWLFMNFYYGDSLPRNVSVGIMMSGLFITGWGLLTESRIIPSQSKQREDCFQKAAIKRGLRRMRRSALRARWSSSQ